MREKKVFVMVFNSRGHKFYSRGGSVLPESPPTDLLVQLIRKKKSQFYQISKNTPLIKIYTQYPTKRNRFKFVNYWVILF